MFPCGTVIIALDRSFWVVSIPRARSVQRTWSVSDDGPMRKRKMLTGKECVIALIAWDSESEQGLRTVR